MTYLTLRRPTLNPYRFFNAPFVSNRPYVVSDENTMRPTTDISETDDSYEVRAELPGIPKDDIHISVKDNVLSIKGEKRQENEDESKTYKRIERRYGTFERNFTLPPKVDTDNIKAKFNDGVLTLSIPKPEEVKPKEIPIATETVVDASEEK